MNIKRFFGKNSREALSMVRKELGDDAVILSNRAVNGGNEIMAFREDEMNSIIAAEPRVTGIADGMGSRATSSASIASSRLHEEDDTPDFSARAIPSRDMPSRDMQQDDEPSFQSRRHESRPIARTNAAARDTSLSREPISREPMSREIGSREKVFASNDEAPSLLSMLTKKASALVSDTVSERRAANESSRQLARPARLAADASTELASPAAAAPVLAAEANQQMTEMLNEMRVMRNAIESQLTAMSWGNIQQREPVKSRILSTLLAAGFSAALSRQLAEKVPAGISYERALVWTQSILSRNLHTVDDENEVLDKGGIFALIGPTGVGKTTTTAKLAARYVMKHGTQNLGLITTDAYRVGGHEQLRIYGKILGVMVHAVKDEADLKIALKELKNKHTILIDTVGVSQRDRMVAEQIAMLSNSNSGIKKLLCLNATNTGETLTDVVRAYKGKGLDGCIITKVDEAATIGSALDVIIREKLRLYYVANGQRVPEDIHMANKQQLIRHAMKLNVAGNQPFQFLNEELPFVMGTTTNTPKVTLSEAGYV